MSVDALPQRPLILLVEDAETNLDILVGVLADDYEVAVAMDGPMALKAAREKTPDLILLDILMPGMDGYEVCRRLKADPELEGIPVIFLTVLSEIDNKTKGFDLGAVDYITKPFDMAEVRARVRTHLDLVMARRKLKRQHDHLEALVAQRTRELMICQDVTIHSLASLAETRDNETGGHLLRTQHYVRALAGKLAENPRFAGFLTPENIELMCKSAPLHDIGKVGVPDQVLLKPCSLNQEEQDTVRRHCLLGYQALDQAERLLEAGRRYPPGRTFLPALMTGLAIRGDAGEEPLGVVFPGVSPSFLTLAKVMALTHHERWDGQGYPRGLKGEDIPLPGRIMALADSYDVIMSKRIYKTAADHYTAVAMITRERGGYFDPDVVDAFLEVQGEFRRVSLRYADGREREPLAE